MNSWLRRIVLLLLRFLEENLDSDLKARLEKYREERASLERYVRIVQDEIAAKDIRLQQLATERSALEQSIASREAQLSTLKQEVIQLDSENDSPSSHLTDGDVLRARL